MTEFTNKTSPAIDKWHWDTGPEKNVLQVTNGLTINMDKDNQMKIYLPKSDSIVEANM